MDETFEIYSETEDGVDLVESGLSSGELRQAILDRTMVALDRQLYIRSSIEELDELLDDNPVDEEVLNETVYGLTDSRFEGSVFEVDDEILRIELTR